MVIRLSSTPGFRFAQDKRGQRWLPLVALALLPFGAFAAVETATQSPADRDEIHELQSEFASRFTGLREEQFKLAENYRQLQANQRQLQDGYSLMLAQVQTVKEDVPVPSQKVAQAEPSPNNRGVVQLLNQVEALNGELNRLRGQMEVLSNDVNNAQKRQRDMYVDLDTRLRRIEQGGAGKKDGDNVSALEERIRKLEQGSATPASIPQPVTSTAAVPVNLPPPAAATAAAPAAATAAASTSPVNPGAAVASSSSSSLPPASLSATDQAAIQRSYDNAFGNYRLSDYPSAIRGFDAFLKSYPKHALAANAQYWIGESYSHLKQYRDAIDAERRLLGTYPDSTKAPDALLIIGTAEGSLGDNAAARKTFEELIAKYPASDAAEKAKGRLAKLK